jgi:hypothetical protein
MSDTISNILTSIGKGSLGGIIIISGSRSIGLKYVDEGTGIINLIPLVFVEGYGIYAESNQSVVALNGLEEVDADFSFTYCLPKSSVSYENLELVPLEDNSNIYPTPVYNYNTNETIFVLPIGSYTALKVNQAINSKDEGERVVKVRSGEVITSEVKDYIEVNSQMPRFKNYGDYITFKKTLTVQNYLKLN